MLGYKDGYEKYEVFKVSKIILHPSTFDSGGMAAAEGMAWGLPGVSYDLESLKTYYPKGMIKSDINNKTNFADNIIKLLTDESYYNKKSEEARLLIASEWSWVKRFNDISDVIIK